MPKTLPACTTYVPGSNLLIGISTVAVCSGTRSPKERIPSTSLLTKTSKVAPRTATEPSLLTVTDEKLEPLLELPLTVSSNWCGVEIAMYHGSPWDFLQGRIYPDYQNWERFADVPADIILLGNTHYPLVKFVHGKHIINPGSVGQARNCSGLACCAILDLSTTSVSLHNIPYPTKSIIESAKVNDPNIKYLVEVLER